MATPPLIGGDAEQEILAIFLHYKIQVGECLSVEKLRAQWGKKTAGLDWKEFGPGIQSLIDKGFVDQKNNGADIYCLTEAGARVM